MTPRGHRILSVDGAGIYGLISATWLRQMCERDRTFLAAGEVDLFAGISSGAVNTLLLARHERPRDALLAGELDAFWSDPRGAFANPDPRARLLSYLGLAPWYDAQTFLGLLERSFGDMRLRDLPNRVLISTFDWTGQRPVDFPAGVRLAPEARTGDHRPWGPRLFHTFASTPDDGMRVVDLAYGAAAPGGLRPVRGGIGDAGAFTGNPSVEAIAAMARWLEGWPPVDDRAAEKGTPISKLHDISCLSLGDGSVQPSYWLQSFDFGMLPLTLLPTNPFQGHWFSPVWAANLQAPEREAAFISRTLLVDRYHRLNPGIMEMPMLLASLYARSPFLRGHIFTRISMATESPRSREAVAAALGFVGNGWRAPG